VTGCVTDSLDEFSIFFLSFWQVLNLILHHLTETASDDDAMDVSEDDFFMSGSSSDEEADDEWTDKSAKYDPQITALRHCTCFLMFTLLYRATFYYARLLFLIFV
jgi:hypothetical protein